MLHSTKSQLARLYSTKQHTRSKNHYDTLNITPYATQSEVKSAYYKLTLQYHPDKNKSKYAKQKFQDVSEAYEVLSNHDQRKIYDREIMIRQQPVSTTTQEPISDDKHKVYSGSSRIYNFDAWTHAHYGKQMYAARIRRQAYENMKAMEELDTRSKKSLPYIEFALFLVTLVFVAMSFREKFDVPVSQRHKTESKDK
ncbi:DnaJ like protein subfamily C member 30 [Trachymyrmex septentrionalis]|uniref:DnaJ like protein subfamily C member 30 n=2 Tax=Trachymyrmex septentrionalis TaxID=34720 RepID=A0A195F7U5_9HYME|nr:DnaJ like protein subfamily C member 30 [Trachymyrmex septentrionalis]